MKSKFRQIALLGKYHLNSGSSANPSSRQTIENIAEFLHTLGCEVILEHDTAAGTGLSGYPVMRMEEIGKSCDLAIVLGGDGTHRAVALASGDIPLATLSTGTNNAFPALGEATVVGLAAGLAATGRVMPACIHNKCLRITHPGGESMALVDVGVMPAEHIGARAVYAADAVEAVFAAFAEPDAIGLSAIAAACGPIARTAPFGRWVRQGAGTARLAAISPGLVQAVDVAASGLMQPGIAFELGSKPAILALDGEPEIVLDGRGPASVRLALDGPITLDVATTLAAAHAADALVVTARPEPALRDGPPAAPGPTGADRTIAPA